jgi:hypothetical protein
MSRELKAALELFEKSAAAALSTMGSDEFVELLKSKLDLKGRAIRFNTRSLGYGTVFINFSNVPEEKARGAAFENNRIQLSVDGFGKEDSHSPPPTGKVKVEQSVRSLPREWNLRAKTGTPEAVAKYIADYLNKVVREVEPKINPWD